MNSNYKPLIPRGVCFDSLFLVLGNASSMLDAMHAFALDVHSSSAVCEPVFLRRAIARIS
jgi:hypothetical protein